VQIKPKKRQLFGLA